MYTHAHTRTHFTLTLLKAPAPLGLFIMNPWCPLLAGSQGNTDWGLLCRHSIHSIEKQSHCFCMLWCQVWCTPSAIKVNTTQILLSFIKFWWGWTPLHSSCSYPFLNIKCDEQIYYQQFIQADLTHRWLSEIHFLTRTAYRKFIIHFIF